MIGEEPTDINARARAILGDRLAKLRDGSDGPDGELFQEVTNALDIDDVARPYALVTQPLCKVLDPEGDIRSPNSTWQDFSPRSLCRSVIVGLNDNLGRPLKHSEDPYVSNPLRGGMLGSAEWTTRRRSADIAAWSPVVALFNAVEESSDPVEAADRLLTCVLQRLSELALDLATFIEQMLRLQARISGGEDQYEARRALLVRGIRTMEGLLEDRGVQLLVQGSVGRGDPAEIPWVRIYNPEHSPSATTGEYLVLLFASDGTVAYLSLIIGTEGSSIEAIDQRVADLRNRLQADARFLSQIDLRSTQQAGRPRAYEHGVIFGVPYNVGNVPPDDAILQDVVELSAMLAQLQSIQPADPGGLLHRLTPDGLESALGDLMIPVATQLDAIAALRAGKHLLLTGPPGTGKTTFGQAIAQAAQDAGVCNGWTTVTATAAWTAYDTIGGYQQQLDGTLQFRPGAALRAIDSNRWLVIDELNRADVDKAFGSLFTVLSGQTVELSLEEQAGDETCPVAIVPLGESAPDGVSPHFVSPGWRIIATMNSWDQDLLFNLSFALIRRFAVIRLGPVQPALIASLLGEIEPIEDDALADSVAALSTIPHAELGPAVLRSVARFVRERKALGIADETPGDWLSAALSSEVIPQLAHLSPLDLSDVASHLSTNVLRDKSPAEVKNFLERHLGFSIAEPRFVADQTESPDIG